MTEKIDTSILDGQLFEIYKKYHDIYPKNWREKINDKMIGTMSFEDLTDFLA